MRGIAIIALVGCTTSDLDFRGTSFRCDDGVTCPAGFSCVANRCVMVGAVDAAPPACGKIERFLDNFDNNTRDNPPWDANSGSANEQGGAAVITIPAGGPAAGAYASTQRADLTASHVYIEVLQVTAETYLRVQSDDQHFLEMAVQNNVLSFKQDGAAVGTAIGYDNVAHRWWRISETGGTVSFDTSLDGNNPWTSRATTPVPAYAGSVTLSFGARAQSQAATGTAQFDNLDGGGAPRGPCP